MFSFFKRQRPRKHLKVDQSDKGGFKFSLDLREHQLADSFKVKIPVEFVPYESDRFRAKTEDDQKAISITNYQKKWEGEVIDQKFFKELKLALYEKFVDEGGYEPYDDLKATDHFIRKSFKVDQETQYYFTSARIIGDRLVISEFIIREIGLYNRLMMPTLEIINNSLEYTGDS
ncbi:hypothetical protein [Sphingobacterium yanglingense]|uniref:Uncharacterized protein n=1 Tax=Sphingobacterium yanglingense TaxID=1437280 RepID=A0A4R6WEQ0_9SPHI|nr:hypothetical protein [Sphingobacterium yanglingense]TDQ78282.1 hypothetical protein CLV99_2262 [Sphingobacterium yanglingense]